MVSLADFKILTPKLVQSTSTKKQKAVRIDPNRPASTPKAKSRKRPKSK